jgi:hypothetical protein
MGIYKEGEMGINATDWSVWIKTDRGRGEANQDK